MMTISFKLDNAVTEQCDMVLVPRNPTQAMIDAAWADALGEDAVGVWRSMIAEWQRTTVDQNRR